MADSTVPGFDAWGECLGESWEIRLERSFFGRIAVTLVDTEAEREGALFRGWSMGSGKIRLPDRDRELSWGGPILSLSSHHVRTPGGARLLRLKAPLIRPIWKETKVLVSRSAWVLPELPRLLLLSWFLKLHKETGKTRFFRRVKDRR